uniref:Uncharacterized protein n=1 Tax=Romanomermis culicivorax TaxID=13658 RepID=A0A915HEG0_ROMCU
SELVSADLAISAQSKFSESGLVGANFQGGGVSSLLFVTCASSNDQIYFTFTLGSPLICRNNGIDLLQGVIVSLHYFKSA